MSGPFRAFNLALAAEMSMNPLVPLLLLFAATTVAAAERIVPHQEVKMDRELTAQVVGADRSRSVPKSSEVLVFDSHTGAAAYATVSNSPRTFMGMPFDLADAAGSDPLISRVVVYLGYTGDAAQTYSQLRARFRLWNDWSSVSTPVFSNPPDLIVEADVPGPITLNPGSMTAIGLPLDPPIPLSGLTRHGIAVNFQGNTGAGLVSSDDLTPVLRYGANPVAVGSNRIPSGVGYINGSGRTDFNFEPSDVGSVQQSNQALALQLHAVPTPAGGPLVQDGGFEAGFVPTYWTGYSTNFTTPLCDASCGVPVRTGAYLALLGGSTDAEVTSVQQSGVLDARPTSLRFHLWWGSSVDAPPDPGATFKVKIDGQTIFTLTPATAAAYTTGYTQASVDISAFADGDSHTLRFESNSAAASVPTIILLDDISLDSGLVRDGSFEAGKVPTYWVQSSTNFDSPICDGNCGSASARTGSYFTWFGGALTWAETMLLEQTGQIGEGPKTLDFYLHWFSSVEAPPDPNAYLRVKIDGDTIFSLTPATAAPYSAGYTRASVNISAYADGQDHTLRFEYHNDAAPNSTDIALDDISIVDYRIFASGFDPAEP
jgi:hypothetical protein